jgi:hypothetical protein
MLVVCVIALILITVAEEAPAIIRWYSERTVNVTITVSYFGSWNATYSYGSPCPSASKDIQWSGVGSAQRSVTFQGSLIDGFGYFVRFQKDDNFSLPMTVTVQADYLGRYTNSTTAPYGVVDFGTCMAS